VSDSLRDKLRPTVLSVDLDAIISNLRLLKDYTGGRSQLAVVKANAYGMGAVPVARALIKGGAAWLGVALAEEGVQLRRAGLSVPILMLGPAAPSQAGLLLRENITPAVYSIGFLKALEREAELGDTTFEAHLKIDSGMGRVGFRPEEIPAVLTALARSPRVRITGLFSNLASADDPASSQTEGQLALFLEIAENLRSSGVELQWIHLANSSGLLAHPDTHLSLCRPGLSLYGLRPSAALPDIGLKAALTLETVVSQVKHMPADVPVGYSASYFTPHDQPVGILPVGYADGLPRLLSNRGSVLIGGKRCPIIGRVSMDLTAVNLEPAGTVYEGTPVTLWGRDGQESLGPWDWARWSQTIPYEVMTGVGCRVARTYIEQNRRWTESTLL
jgi:alanine racemase